MATTRHGQKGIGVRPYAGFAPKSPASGPKSSANVTRLLSIGIGGRRRKSGKGIGPFTRLTSIGINGRRVEFEPKNPIIPPIELVVTRLLTFGIGGKRVSFEPKDPASTRVTGGGRVKKRKKKLTQEEAEGLEAYGRARMGIVEPELLPEIERIIGEESQEVSILPDRQIEDEKQFVSLSTDILDSQVKQEILEPDIALMIAIIEAT